jgi:DNA replication protein DnaC
LTLREKPLTNKESYAMLLQAGFPLLYLEGQWQNVTHKDKIQDWLYRAFIEKELNKGVYLWGGVGSGKSTLAGLMACFIKRHFYGEVLFTGCAEMIASIYHGTSASNFKECSVLVLDDLGKEYHHEYGLSRLHEVVEYRYSRLLTTIVTSNFSQYDLILKGGLWQSMGDRLKDERWMKTMKISGESKRICSS